MMTILKHAVLSSLTIAFFGSLKIALFVYTLFLSDTAFASVGSASDGRHIASYGRTEGNGSATAG
jgi:hypothetical protein